LGRFPLRRAGLQPGKGSRFRSRSPRLGRRRERRASRGVGLGFAHEAHDEDRKRGHTAWRLGRVRLIGHAADPFQNVYFDAFRDEGLVFLDQDQAAALERVRVESTLPVGTAANMAPSPCRTRRTRSMGLASAPLRLRGCARRSAAHSSVRQECLKLALLCGALPKLARTVDIGDSR
jgi:hypothetical protein